MLHGIAIVACAALAERLPAARTSGWLFALGVLLFSGSLYGLSLTGLRVFGPITPVGGVFFIAGWLWLSVQAVRRSTSPGGTADPTTPLHPVSNRPS